MTQIVKKTYNFEIFSLDNLIYELCEGPDANLKDLIEKIFNSIDIIALWADKIINNLKEIENKYIQPLQDFSEESILRHLHYFEFIPVIANPEYINKRIRKYCKPIKRDEKVIEESLESEIELSKSHINDYYNDLIKNEETLESVMDGIMRELQGKTEGLLFEHFFKSCKTKVDNFVGLIYLYHYEKIDFFQENKKLKVKLNNK